MASDAHELAGICDTHAIRKATEVHNVTLASRLWLQRALRELGSAAGARAQLDAASSESNAHMQSNADTAAQKQNALMG